MPPRTRASKASQENIGVVAKNKLKSVGKGIKQRKPLSDKTNSASDDNLSPKNLNKEIKTNVKKKVAKYIPDSKERPRRERKLPNRFNKNEVVDNLSNITKSKPSVTKSVKSKTPDQNGASLSPFKTPQQDVDNSLIANRPRRVCRLPSRFDDHSMSPNKFIPVGCHASTPIVLNKISNKVKPTIVNCDKSTSVKNTILSNKKSPQKKIAQVFVSKSNKKKKTVHTQSIKVSPDSNNNANQRLVREKVTNKLQLSPVNLRNENQKFSRKLLTPNFSFRVLEEKKKKSKRGSSHLDVYEFTYDPNEEPPPQKKKRKRAANKKPPKPKTVILKTNYDKNLSQALAALKNVVSKKPIELQKNNELANVLEKVIVPTVIPSESVPINVEITSVSQEPPKSTTSTKEHTHNVQSYNQQNAHNISTRVEDIAADFEPLMDHNDIDYSPVNSPHIGKSPDLHLEQNSKIVHPIHCVDPLNLREGLSFFDDPPVASSSMNMSARKPHETPWRVQFDQLPIKWQVNTYVKANMTPAVESSFINFNDSKNKNKHVYTNIVPDSNDVLPEIIDNNQRNYKQTSIMSFIKEVVDRSASKKKRAKSITPNKTKSVSGITLHNITNSDETPKKTLAIENNYCSPNKETDGIILDSMSNKEISTNNVQTKSSKSGKEKDNDGTYFGFDDSENQENVSPVKVDNPRRGLRSRGRAVLQEINALSGPLRAKVPLAAKIKLAVTTEALNKGYEGMKSATVAPVFPETNASTDVTNVDQSVEDALNDDDPQSVHLFEDIEIVHHLKPSRKSYGKVNKVTFQQTTNADSEYQGNVIANNDSGSSDEDDLADLTFTVPIMEPKTKPKRKVKSKKMQQSKKEKAEMEAWASEFNSMCDDIEEFPLVVE